MHISDIYLASSFSIKESHAIFVPSFERQDAYYDAKNYSNSRLKTGIRSHHYACALMQNHVGYISLNALYCMMGMEGMYGI